MENRVIKFRGMNTDGEWVYGFLFELSFDGYPITCIGTEPLSANDYSEIYKSCYEEVIPETVGQYTGLKDKNGQEIYEGDVLRDNESTVIVKFVDGGFSVDYKTIGGKWRNYSDLFDYLDDYEGEVIGNIYENPERIPEVTHAQ